MKDDKQITLEQYFYEVGITCKEFAALIGYADNYLAMCKNGTRPMSKRMKYLIDRETKGRVKIL